MKIVVLNAQVRSKIFFVKNYDHPIFEAGHQLVDMIYLSKRLN